MRTNLKLHCVLFLQIVCLDHTTYVGIEPPAATSCFSSYKQRDRYIRFGDKEAHVSIAYKIFLLTLNRVSSLLFTREYSCFTCCRHFRHLCQSLTRSEYHQSIILTIIPRYVTYEKLFVRVVRNLPFNVLLLAVISEGNTDTLNPLCTNTAMKEPSS